MCCFCQGGIVSSGFAYSSCVASAAPGIFDLVWSVMKAVSVQVFEGFGVGVGEGGVEVGTELIQRFTYFFLPGSLKLGKKSMQKSCYVL